MSQVIKDIDFKYYIDIVKTVVERGASLKSVLLGKLNPLSAFEELTLSTDELETMVKNEPQEFHIVMVVEYVHPSGLINHSERYHFWKMINDGETKTWMETDGTTTTYAVKSWGMTDAFGKFIRGLRKKN